MIINIQMEFDGTKAAESDQIKDTVDYDTISKKIIHGVESSQFFLVEKLAAHILKLILSRVGIPYGRGSKSA